nr:ribosomal protein S10 [Tanacetum cinerariifolium]
KKKDQSKIPSLASDVADRNALSQISHKANMQQLNIQEERYVDEPEQEVSSVVTPNHLEVQTDECSNLSFGGYGEVEDQHAEADVAFEQFNSYDLDLGYNGSDDFREGAAWLSSARVVRCLVKSYNERNPRFVLLRHAPKEKVFAAEEPSDVPALLIECQHVDVLSRKTGHSGEPPGGVVRSGFSTPHQNDSETNKKQGCKAKRIQKDCLSSDCSQQLGNMKLESLVIVDQHATVNMYPGPVHIARHTLGIGSRRGTCGWIESFAMEIPFKVLASTGAGRAKGPNDTCLEDGQTQQSNDSGADSPSVGGGQETAISRHITTYRQHQRDLGRQPDWESDDP